MSSCFLAQNKFLWGFSINKDGKENLKITKFKSQVVKDIVDHYYENDLEIHVMPKEKMPFVMVIRPNVIWYYLTSEYDCGAFMKNIMVDGNYELCQGVV